MKQDIEIIRGTSNTIHIRVTDASGANYTLASGEKIIFGVKKRPEHDECVLKKIITEITGGVCTVEINPEDTESLPFGKYFYDAGLLSGGDYYNVVPYSEFYIKPNITNRGDGE